MSLRIARAIATALALCSGLAASAAAEPAYEGRKKCSSCHKSQADSWSRTAHARAVDSLRPKNKAEAKRRAKLDPEKDYTQDKDCIGCHVDGFGKEGGYEVQEPSKYLAGVGCESCHGPGSDYRRLHRIAGEAFERTNKAAPRKSLADAGQDFEFVERCNACHMNYAGSPWKGAKPPHTPFTPQLDKKYAFDFQQAVRNAKAMHEHFKLDGTFTGAPVPSFREEFQAAAKPAAKGKEE